ncbi:retron system putative HNH endonuclease [Mucilaginibacter psychrotolerans]|uniref:TIGR02646 family protein n=1 Tax=Mucilaginibacter psychrotolerans TaxID=1524096 RepID=A0A4Y8SJS8_9SPHI|nr:retron system putative HNH endonuclease [Mucilaginibacter psychrotolerans]TFF39142.1 TIGR02646 family protein [Mucilaginibacter psychrotolerans]
MEYIRKQEGPPEDWDLWFTTATGVRTFDYGSDYGALTNLPSAKEFLLREQNFLCAYCQQTLTKESASIEHVIPKEYNVELSTNYYNLVAVCKSPLKDPITSRLHCDKEKQSRIIIPLIFISNNSANIDRNNSWFDARSDGSIVPKHNASAEHFKQTEAFIETLNLNHLLLREARAKDALDPIIQVSSQIPINERANFWKSRYSRILVNPRQPFRQFMLIYIGKKIGLS